MSSVSSREDQRILVVRLSSLGDLILATSAIGALREKPSTLPPRIDWIVAREFAPLLEGVPGVDRVIPFDRRAGLKAWLQLAWQFRRRAREYAFALDLHRSLRSWIFRLITAPNLSWRTLAKERWRLEGFFFWRQLWPRGWRPRPMVDRFSETVSAERRSKPDLTHLRQTSLSPTLVWPEESPVGIAPGALWAGKQWPVASYVAVIRELLNREIPVVLFGSGKDLAAQQVVAAVQEEWGDSLCSQNWANTVGRLDLRELGVALTRCRVLLGNDSGLSHYAEAVGTAALTIFGPTSPEQGFGPWRPESRSIEASLWCRPCSRGGERCFRTGQDRYRCIQQVSVPDVLSALLLFLEKGKVAKEGQNTRGESEFVIGKEPSSS